MMRSRGGVTRERREHQENVVVATSAQRRRPPSGGVVRGRVAALDRGADALDGARGRNDAERPVDPSGVDDIGTRIATHVGVAAELEALVDVQIAGQGGVLVGAVEDELVHGPFEVMTSDPFPAGYSPSEAAEGESVFAAMIASRRLRRPSSATVSKRVFVEIVTAALVAGRPTPGCNVPIPRQARFQLACPGFRLLQ